ncbi:uncharacterized protein LOC129231445 [Uloborus diversus]|uniref:uncharacterized protein LOC129231445 n=1 Tax=Uloborus diversus TaxID=327109 RepID=UPI0024095201|nr:uncharacterized protein LOC129231445 [Uloborus diversus]
MLEIDRDFERIRWITVHETSFLAKFVFKSDNYSIVMTDLTDVYIETLDLDSVCARFDKINPGEDIKPFDILSSLGKTIRDYLYKNEGFVIVRKYNDRAVEIKLQFRINKGIFFYAMLLIKQPAEKMFEYVTGPFILYGCISKNWLECKQFEHDEPPLLGFKSTTDAVQFDSAWLTSMVPREEIMKSFLGLQGNLYELLSENNCAMYSGSGFDR